MNYIQKSHNGGFKVANGFIASHHDITVIVKDFALWLYTLREIWILQINSTINDFVIISNYHCVTQITPRCYK